MKLLPALAGLLLAALAVAVLEGGTPPADPAPGRRIYRDGVLPSGRPLAAELPSGVRLEGAAAACATCHRRSGFGGAEGTVLVPPVTGPALFEGASRDRASLFRPLFQEDLDPAVLARLHALGERPAYTAESLATALREGRDPAGRPLDPLMPRYPLTGEEVGHLAAYLRTLSAASAPGVEERTIRFATVVTPGADPGRLAALREVQEAYLRWHNAEVEGRLLRPVPPLGEEEAYAGGWRRWQLDLWELHGAPSTWDRQLAERQRAQPIFALLGGLDGAGEGSWPAHAFCEAEEIPCLFPGTDLPPAETGASTLYLSGGIPAQAAAVAEQLWGRAATGQGGLVVQVYRPDARGREAARLLRQALAGSVSPEQADRQNLALVDRPLAAGHASDHASAGASDHAPDWPALLAGRPAALVLWLPAAGLAGLPDTDASTSAADPADPGPALYLSSAFLDGELPALPPVWAGRTAVAWRFARPGEVFPQAFRARAWLRARGVAPRPNFERLQLDTYTTLALADAALTHLGSRLSRDLFVEAVEREADRLPNPGVYPRLSLGPGQRIAAKACTVVQWPELTAGPLQTPPPRLP